MIYWERLRRNSVRRVQNFQVYVKFRDASDCINYFGTTAPSNNELPVITSGYLLVDYVYLETEERNLFMTISH